MNQSLSDSIKNNPVQLTFSKAQLTYDKHSEVQIDVGNKLVEMTNQASNRYESVIDIGCGTGLTTKQLLKKIAYNKFLALDFSKNFLDQAKAKNSTNDVIYLHNDFDQYLKNKLTQYNLVFASMSMQWSRDFNNLLISIYSSLMQSGQLIFSIPLINTFQEINNDCHVNDFYSLTEMATMLKKTGFDIEMAESKTYTLFFDSQITRLRSIKKTGANCYKGKRDKSNFHTLRAMTRESKGQDLPLTYEIGLFKASKKMVI